jgi:choline dehydrogenase-like flavoprotein
MIVDARDFDGPQELECDLCIIGAGAAGISLAREFVGRSEQVIILESGGLDFDWDTQALAKGRNVGIGSHALEATRLRYFGGTSNHWGGTCRPLDASDFQSRPWIPHSGWPITRQQLEPFYARAQEVLQLGPFDYDVAPMERAIGPALPMPPGGLETAIFRQSPPTRLGHVYREEVRNAENVRAVLHANVLEIVSNESGDTVQSVRGTTLDGKALQVRSRSYVMAAGGIENARLLLLSDRVNSRGLGNQHDLVGRYFMDHPIWVAGLLQLANDNTPVTLYQKNDFHGHLVKGFLTPSNSLAEAKALVNCGIRPGYERMIYVSQGVHSFREITDAFRELSVPDDLSTHVRNVMDDFGAVSTDAYSRWIARKGDARGLGINFWTEASPNPDSRVTLGSEIDALGQRKVVLDWRLNESDLTSVKQVLTQFGQALGQTGLGRIKLNFDPGEGWPERMSGSYHHMGTTRMHDDPKQGVVDANCRVHGLENLHVAGSSVFTTSGQANPTLTIVALALRLADHLKNRLQLEAA